MIRTSGRSSTPVSLPFTPGVDFVGVVADTGPSVTDFAPGDRVFGFGIGNGPLQRAYAEYATAPVDRVVGIGENQSAFGVAVDGVARSKDVTYRFINASNAPDLRQPLRALGDLVEMGKLSTVIADTYDLDAAGEPQRAVIEDSFFGKLVITP